MASRTQLQGRKEEVCWLLYEDIIVLKLENKVDTTQVHMHGQKKAKLYHVWDPQEHWLKSVTEDTNSDVESLKTLWPNEK